MSFSKIQTNLISYDHTSTHFKMTFEVQMNSKSDLISVSKNDSGVIVVAEIGLFTELEFFVVKMRVLELAILHSTRPQIKK